MTRYDIALNKPLYDFIVTKGKTAVIKQWWPIRLEKSPRLSTCHACREKIPAKDPRFKVWTVSDPWRKYFFTHLYHEKCLPEDMKRIIQQKEKQSNVADINGRSFQKSWLRAGSK